MYCWNLLKDDVGRKCQWKMGHRKLQRCFNRKVIFFNKKNCDPKQIGKMKENGIILRHPVLEQHSQELSVQKRIKYPQNEKVLLFIHHFDLNLLSSSAVAKQQIMQRKTVLSSMVKKIEYSAYFRMGSCDLKPSKITCKVNKEPYKSTTAYGITAIDSYRGNIDLFLACGTLFYVKITEHDLLPFTLRKLTTNNLIGHGKSILHKTDSTF